MERKKALDGGRRIKYPVFVCMCVCMCVRERGREKRRRRACGCLVSLYMVDVSFYLCDCAVLSEVGFSLVSHFVCLAILRGFYYTMF